MTSVNKFISIVSFLYLETIASYCRYFGIDFDEYTFVRVYKHQKINLIFAIVGMFDEARKWNRTNFENYIEIYIKSNIKNIIKSNKKKIYKKKGAGDIVGINIKPELPKKPDITINNNLKTSMNNLSTQLLNKINKSI